VNFMVGSLSASVQLAINNVTKQRKVLFNSISQSDQIDALPDWSRYARSSLNSSARPARFILVSS
jgi:branched-chain amino acid transport system substrate-binding protein